jgi:hypothetical protein
MGGRTESSNIAAETEIEEEELSLIFDELQSLGIDAKRRGNNDLNNKQELDELACNIKLSLYLDYKLEYSKMGKKYKEEATATVNI